MHAFFRGDARKNSFFCCCYSAIVRAQLGLFSSTSQQICKGGNFLVEEGAAAAAAEEEEDRKYHQSIRMRHSAPHAAEEPCNACVCKLACEILSLSIPSLSVLPQSRIKSLSKKKRKVFRICLTLWQNMPG